MSLGFGNPALLWGLAAALVPLAIHLFFRRRPRPTPFPAIHLLLRAQRESRRRLKLRRVLLFAARTTLLLAAALAIAKPRLERGGAAAAAAPRGPSATALVLDASASMRYRLGGSTLFDRARDDVADALAALGSDEAATLVVCDGRAPDAAPPSYDHGAVRRAIAEARPSFAWADLGGCVAAAARALSDPSVATLGKRVVVATDLAATGWRLDAPAPLVSGPQGNVRPEVKVLDAARGAELPNLAVTDLAVDPDLSAGPRGRRITATIANSGTAPAKDVPVELRVGLAKDAAVAIRGFAEVPPGGTVKKTFTHAFAQGGPVAIAVGLAEDALAVDDARAAVVQVPKDARALVVNGDPSPSKLKDEAFFVDAALLSPASPVRATTVDADALPRVKLAEQDVVFLLNVRSLGEKATELRAFVERGGGLFVAVGENVDPDVYAKELGDLLPRLHVTKDAGARAARFADVDFAHPALAVFTGDAQEGLLGARTTRYLLVKPDRARRDKVLASYDDGAPALVESRFGRGRVVLFTSSADREWSDWSIRTSFLPAVQRFAAYLSGALEDARPAVAVVGGSREVNAGDGRALVSVLAPDGAERSVASLARPQGPPVVAVDRPGVWQVKVSEGGETRVDPALAFAGVPDPRESDTRRVDPAELTAWFGGEQHARLEGEPRREHDIPLWSVLLALALAAFFLEGVLAA